MATWRLVRAAERAGVRAFPLLLGPRRLQPPPGPLLPRQGPRRAGHPRVVRPGDDLRPSIVYTPGDPWLTLLERLSLLPVVPLAGAGRALFQPIWAQDVADCVIARSTATASGRRAYELAGPDTLSHEADRGARAALLGRRRPLVHVPQPVVRRALRAASASRPDGVRHLRGGRADGRLDDHAARHRRRRGARRHAAPDGLGPRRARPLDAVAAYAARRSAQGLAASSWRASESSVRLARRAPDQLHAERQAVLASRAAAPRSRAGR